VSALFDTLQRTLETIYRIDGPEAASGYRIGREHVEAYFPGASSRMREVLVVANDGEYTDVGLYLADEVLHAAERFADRPCDTTLDAFCVAVEGVSHFVYFTYCGARQARPVSQIELELQAEVDKYLLLRLLSPREDLVSRLFVDIRFAAGLAPEEAARYRVANNEASHYARKLERRFLRGEGERALVDARALYRKPLAEKLAHIARAA